MQRFPVSTPIPPSAEERAFFTQLTALNAFFEAASAGQQGKTFGERAAVVDELLDRYFVALTSDMRSE